MSLLSAIPGLAKYQASPLPFDREKAFRLLDDAVSLLSSYYPAGALEWLEDHKPDVVLQMKEAESDVNKSIVAENQVDFPGALERFIKLHREAFDVYSARPPVVERQGDLFQGVS